MCTLHLAEMSKRNTIREACTQPKHCSLNRNSLFLSFSLTLEYVQSVKFGGPKLPFTALFGYSELNDLSSTEATKVNRIIEAM